MTFKTKIFLWFLVATAILIFDVTFVYKSFIRLADTKKALIETNTTIDRLSDVISSLKDVQSSQRGYIITGTKDYLSPYTLALPKIVSDFAELDIIFANHPEQQKNLQTLKKEVNNRIALADEIIATYDTRGQEAAFAIVRKGIGKKEMDEIRHLINEMISTERFRLQNRRNITDEALQSTFYISGAGLAACFVIMGFVFYQIARENRLRGQTEDTLKHALSEMQTLSDENRNISHMAEYLQSCQTPDEAYKILEDLMPSLFPASSGRISTFNNSRNLIESTLTWGGNAHRNAGEFMPQECWALRRGQPHIYRRGGTEPICTHISESSASSLCLPMQAHGETIGLLHMASDDETAPLHGERPQRLAKRISEQASLAISNLKLQNKLLVQSTHDPLTRLFNRRYLETTLEREISRAKRSGQPLCVMVLDIDHFKKFNDTRGHDAGDALLVHFAKMLQAKTRKEDIVCRYGGEEFVIVLPGASPDIGLMLAEKLCAATREMDVMFNGVSLGMITVSIGIASYPQHGESQEDLISRADAALYMAKHGGRNQALLAA